jgi:hypothetical protein
MTVEAMQTLDLKKLHKSLFTAPVGEFVLVDVPELSFLKVDGEGDPNSAPAYERALQWLYSVAYGAKFAAKASGREFVVAPLEGLWHSDDPSSFVDRRKSEWRWTMMIMVPEFVGSEMFGAALAKARKKLGDPPPSLRLESYREGSSLQALHIGPYDAEGPLLARLHGEIMPSQGFTFAGHHHEIYLSDPRKSAPDKLRTILRQPVQPVGLDRWHCARTHAWRDTVTA